MLLAASPAAGFTAEPSKIDFNRDIRPILADHCYTCHGPDEAARKAKLRLDRRDDAVRPLRSGTAALVPGNHTASGLFQRITADNERERMPPPKSGKSLSPSQIEMLGRWLDDGAHYEQHWAYVSPRWPAIPAVRNVHWPRNPIDHFILNRLEHEGLTPAPEADRATLLRRVTLDLTGLPPTPEELEAVHCDTSPEWYEKAVDRLLASPHYGERMALPWLDLARYADTNGYRLDNHRDIWQFRDWVINALNANMPFDQFTVEQLAGDLLPNATTSQKVATGFHRNTMVNFGNGSDPREYLAKAVSDRVVTTATVWLGTTLGCAQCHDHKYDPFTQKDFYRLYAYFNNIAEKGLDGAKSNPVPVLLTPQPTLVMEELPRPRTTRILVRGDFLNEGDQVTPGVPESLPAVAANLPADRLGLARWLVQPDHPLTARVTVNRAWQLFFGTGIVKTLDDFGSQGDLPSHPELLDWLATEFVSPSPLAGEGGVRGNLGWDVKQLHRLIVTSATYRQSSNLTDALRERDPHNRLLARGPRVRLDAETIRDAALASSGLLNRSIGGPSVRPYQPAGLWEQVAVGGNYSSQKYEPSTGPDLYRRGIYTYWKRSLPPPGLGAFDAPTRELCTALRSRTNTPLQALVLLNDPTYVEAARLLGQRAVREGGRDRTAQLTYAFRLCTGRVPTSRELDVLERVYRQQRAIFDRDHAAAEELLHVGETPRAENLDPAEQAAWTAVGNLLLNLDETITRR